MAGTLRGLLLVLLVAGVPASAKDYAVGDASGWTTGVDYKAWAKGKAFNIGDTLSFQYKAGHTVAEVSAADYGACSATNPLRTHGEESTTVPLTRPGTRYFICGTSVHCASGMKIAVTVGGGDDAGTSSPTTRPESDATPTAKSNSDASGAARSGARGATGLLLLGAVGLAALMG